MRRQEEAGGLIWDAQTPFTATAAKFTVPYPLADFRYGSPNESAAIGGPGGGYQQTWMDICWIQPVCGCRGDLLLAWHGQGSVKDRSALRRPRL